MITKQHKHHINISRLAAIILLLLLLFVVGQVYGAAPEPEPILAASPDKATVVLYREDKLAASAIDYRPYLNDVPMTVLPNGTWCYAIVPAGKYDLWLEQYAPRGHPRGVRSRAVKSFDWHAGQVHYIKVDSVSMPGLVSRAQGLEVDPVKARGELEELSLAGEPLHYPSGDWQH